MFILSGHYRSPLTFSEEALAAAKRGIERLRQAGHLKFNNGKEGSTDTAEYRGRFTEAMDDDLNTANAIALLFEKVKEMNKAMDSPLDDPSKATLSLERRHLYLAAAVLGFLAEEPEAFFEALAASTQAADSGEIENLIEERTSARKNKDWAKARACFQAVLAVDPAYKDAGGACKRWKSRSGWKSYTIKPKRR
jgi:cysteinyl-tRNA synthetase